MWEIRTTRWTERLRHGHQYHDNPLQYSIDWFSQWDTSEGTLQEQVMGHQWCSRLLWWEERFEEEAVWSRRSKRVLGSKQDKDLFLFFPPQDQNYFFVLFLSHLTGPDTVLPNQESKIWLKFSPTPFIWKVSWTLNNIQDRNLQVFLRWCSNCRFAFP